MASTLLIETTWRLNDALSLIRSLQPHIKKVGYHTCLGGGVLNTSVSKKDLDLYFLPLTNKLETTETDKLLAFLAETWGPAEPMRKRKKSGMDQWENYTDETGRRRLRMVPETDDYPEGDAESCYLHKLKYKWSDLRIDVFVLGVKPNNVAKTAELTPTFDPTGRTPAEDMGPNHWNPPLAFELEDAPFMQAAVTAAAQGPTIDRLRASLRTEGLPGGVATENQRANGPRGTRAWQDLVESVRQTERLLRPDDDRFRGLVMTTRQEEEMSRMREEAMRHIRQDAEAEAEQHQLAMIRQLHTRPVDETTPFRLDTLIPLGEEG